MLLSNKPESLTEGFKPTSVAIPLHLDKRREEREIYIKYCLSKHPTVLTSSAEVDLLPVQILTNWPKALQLAELSDGRVFAF